MRGDRLIKIILLLQAHGRLTSKQLADELEVSERTVHRDMEALSGAGVPVIADRGKNGGWSLLDNYRTSLTGLKEAEIRALLVSHSTRMLDDLGLADTLDEARMKLLAALPSIYREQASNIWNRIHIDTSAWRSRKEHIAAFETLKEAIWGHQSLHMAYQKADGSRTTRTVGPLGLVAKGSRWYLVASQEDGSIRTFRASRIISAELTGEVFARPENFRLAQYWEASTRDFIDSLPTFEVRIEAHPDILPRLTFTDKFVQAVDIHDSARQEESRTDARSGQADTHTDRTDAPYAQSDTLPSRTDTPYAQSDTLPSRTDTRTFNEGWLPVRLAFDTEDEALRYLLGYGDRTTIIEPAYLREKIARLAEAAAAWHSRS